MQQEELIEMDVESSTEEAAKQIDMTVEELVKAAIADALQE